MKYSDNTQFQDYCKLFDIIALYETWQGVKMTLKTFYRDTQILMLFENEHEILPGGSGGVRVFVKDGVMQTSGVKHIFHNFHACVVLLFYDNIFRRNDDIIMIFAYVAPENSQTYMDENYGLTLLKEKNREILSQYRTAELFVAGDLNARIGNL